ncbi:inverse autotransporter beta domain-containing protein [Anaerospora sp.]|uniref:inverse autotransporter beta domain-containing protein n=1 Tax=Anaerospora sp. TaxID=1960278 RepID=UPI00289F7E61|nr:inverse autotransporter beta domain-containing protein [Anaerospora sp.]
MKKLVPGLIASSLLLSAVAVYAEEVSTKHSFVSIGNSYIAQEIQNLKGDNAPDWLKRTDIGFSFQTDGKPIYSIETVQPIGKQSNRITNFTQFRFGNDLSAGTVMNLGFGHRVLSLDKSSMFGMNAFYDRGFRYGHARIGGGVEYFQGRNEYRANVYHALSGEKEVDTTNHIFEKALSGYDYSIGTSFANAPWAKVYLTGFHWDYTYSNDANGYKVYTQLQVTPKLNLELGYWDDNKGPGEKYGKLMYSLGNKGPAMIEHNKPVFRNEDAEVTVESKRLDKVQRENDIRVERYQKVTTTTGTVTISITRI